MEQVVGVLRLPGSPRRPQIRVDSRLV